MKIKTIFNPHYVSSSNYAKVIIAMTEDDNKFDLFGATCNKLSMKVEVQSFLDKDFKSARKLILGNKPQKVFEQFETNMPEISYIDKCINELHRSFQQYLAKRQLNETDMQMVLDTLSAIRSDNANINANANVASNNSDWTEVDLNTLTETEIMEITTLISREKNPTSGVQYNGKRFYLRDESNGKMTLVSKIDTALSADETVSTVDDRNKVRSVMEMAKIVNAENLRNVVVGNYYKIKDRVNFCNTMYYILDVDGVDTAICQDRIKVLSVYTEKPI
jgi:hypothetical protein